MSLFCTKCGAANADDASFCNKCGAAMADLAAPVVTANSGRHSAPIWNPDASAIWSLLFTPAFGSYLQMRNWIALGEPDKAATAKIWFYLSVAMLVGYVAIEVVVRDDKSSLGLGVAMAFLITWYVVAAREQAKYVKASQGNTYARRPWAKALLLAVAGVVGYLFFGAVVSALLGVE